MNKSMYKCDPFNFVPLTRTPWAGEQISRLKRKFFPENKDKIPELIGESWEVSTDAQFPSKIFISDQTQQELNSEFISLNNLLNANAINILGEDTYKKYGAHFPLLLKWLEANDLLSVQLHPANSNPQLKENECGKPEAWLVLNVEKNGFVYLGFREGLSKEEILTCLKNDALDKCLHKYYPRSFDYISVPPGCVHAIGPGVFVAEPQYVLPKKIAKTWRISDWKRLYNSEGKLSPNGKPRELHAEESLSSINWNLPCGIELEKLLIRHIKSNELFHGDKNNPFALKIYNGTNQSHKYAHLIPNSFSLFTVWQGKVTLRNDKEILHVKGGESGFICASTQSINILLEEQASIAFFALNELFVN